MKKTFALAFASALTLALPLHAEDKPEASTAPAKDYIMLKVEGQDIKRSDIEDAWKTIFQGQGREAPALDSFGPKMEDKFLREVASEYVLYNEAKKEGVQDSPEVKATFEKVKRQIIIQQLLKDKTKDAVSDEKLKAMYDAQVKAQAAAGSSQDEFHARHILLKTKEEAEEVEKRLKKGDDFDALAKEKSEDKGTGAAGGDLGWFTADKMVPEFSNAVIKLKKGQISAPVKSDFGWHVIKLEDRRKATPPAFETVKDSLKQEAGNKAIGEYVKGLMTDVKITEVDEKGNEKPLPSTPDKDDDKALAPSAGGQPSSKDDKGDAEQ